MKVLELGDTGVCNAGGVSCDKAVMIIDPYITLSLLGICAFVVSFVLAIRSKSK